MAASSFCARWAKARTVGTPVSYAAVRHRSSCPAGAGEPASVAVAPPSSRRCSPIAPCADAQLSASAQAWRFPCSVVAEPVTPLPLACPGWGGLVAIMLLRLLAGACMPDRPAREVTYSCAWRSQVHTQLRPPGPLPRYCSEQCKREAQNALAGRMRRMREARRDPVSRPKRGRLPKA